MLVTEVITVDVNRQPLKEETKYNLRPSLLFVQ
jgi:hypothetical protein